jgi:BASS family bile acid:Na+ symporter
MEEGLLILGATAGAPFLPKLAEIAKGNLSLAIGIMLLLSAATIGYVPVVLPFLLPDIGLDPAKIGRSLFLVMLLPLAAGLALKSYRQALASRIKRVLDWVCNISLLPLVLLLALVNIDPIRQLFFSRGIFAGLIFIVLGFCLGWAFGGPRTDTRRVLALGTGQRNVAAALVVGSEGFSDPQVVVMIIVVTIMGLVILVPLCYLLGGHNPKIPR